MISVMIKGGTGQGDIGTIVWVVAIEEDFPEKVLLLEDDNSYNIEYLLNARYLSKYFVGTNLFNFHNTPVKKILLSSPVYGG